MGPIVRPYRGLPLYEHVFFHTEDSLVLPGMYLATSGRFLLDEAGELDADSAADILQNINHQKLRKNNFH